MNHISKKAASALGMAEEPSQAVMCEKYPDIMGAYVTCAEQSSCGGRWKIRVCERWKLEKRGGGGKEGDTLSFN